MTHAAERMWCLACGTVTTTGECDRSRDCPEVQNLVNYADELQRNCRELCVENNALVKALEQIAEGDVPRPLGKRYRSDGIPSKNDQCTHSAWMYEDCGNCISEFARAALSALNTSGEPQQGTAAIVPNQQDDGSKG
jgi:hypothetical protein